MGAFGEKLRKQRELRGIELDAISNTTKISTRMLRALEDERFDQLPGGVFNKGFVRAYARQVGLDEEETVADYLAAVRERQFEQRSHSNVADFSAPAEKTATVAAPPESRDNVVPNPSLLPANSPGQTDGGSTPDHELSTNELQTNEPQTNEPQTNELQTNELRTEERRQLSIHSDRRNEDRRNEDRRNEERRHEARRVEIRRNQNRRDQANLTEAPPSEVPLSEAPRSEARPPQTPNQTSPALPNAPPRTPAADPRGERFRQKYPAGDPAPADESSLPIPWGKLALALLFVTLFLAFWNFRRHAQPPAASQNASAPHLSPAPASAPVAASTQPSSSAPALTVAPTSQAGTTSAKPAANVPQPDAKPPAPPAARTAAAKPPSSFTLQIRADETTWITLTADGKPVVANETLIAPAHTSVRATREIIVKTGNAAGLSFLLNGKAIPAQGNEGEIRTFVFDPAGLQPSPD